MKLTLRELKRLIHEALGGSGTNEAYDKDLVDDLSLKKRSVIAADDAKKTIKRWFVAMGLSRTKKKRKKRSRSS